MSKNMPVQAQWTHDYEKFKHFDENRQLNIAHVEALKASIRANGYLYMPVLVNENMEIIDGQHRFAAVRELSMPVLYITQKGLKNEHVVSMNINARNWTVEDFIHYYSEIEHPNQPHYQKLQHYMNKYRVHGLFATTIIEAFTRSNSSPHADIKSGQFQIGSITRGEKLISLLFQIREKLAPVSTLRNLWKKTAVLTAIMGYYDLPKFSEERLLDVISRNFGEIPPTGNHTVYRRIFRQMYNKGLRTPGARLN